jgi:hypothetical protein
MQGLRFLHIMAMVSFMWIMPAQAVPDYVREQIPQAQLCGEGRLRWLGIGIYDAKLYTPKEGFDAERFSAHALALELRYLRTLSGQAIAERSAKEIEKLGFGTPAQRATWLQSMRDLFPDVAAGKVLTGIHLPGKGAQFFANGKLLGSIGDAEFARAFFAIWLDERTTAPQLRQALLSGRPR